MAGPLYLYNVLTNICIASNGNSCERGAVFIIFIHCRARGREYIKTAVVRSQFCESRKYLAVCDEGKRVEATSVVWRSIKHVCNCLFQPRRPNLHFIYPVGYIVHSSESAATFSLSSAVFQGLLKVVVRYYLLFSMYLCYIITSCKQEGLNINILYDFWIHLQTLVV